MNVLGDLRLLAVGHAILAQVSLAEVRRDDLEIATGVDLGLLPRRRTTAKPLTATARHPPRQDASARDAGIDRRTAPDARTFPLRDGESLPRLLARRLLRAIEIHDPGLRTGIELQFQRLIVLPGDSQASR